MAVSFESDRVDATVSHDRRPGARRLPAPRDRWAHRADVGAAAGTWSGCGAVVRPGKTP